MRKPDSDFDSDDEDASSTEGNSVTSETEVSEVIRRLTCMATSMEVASESDEELFLFPKEITSFA